MSSSISMTCLIDHARTPRSMTVSRRGAWRPLVGHLVSAVVALHGGHGMPKQVYLARFELLVARFGPPKIPKCLENGLFWDKKWVKNGSKMCFSNHFRPFGAPNKSARGRHDLIVPGLRQCSVRWSLPRHHGLGISQNRRGGPRGWWGVPLSLSSGSRIL